jgi:hypothetical protein
MKMTLIDLMEKSSDFLQEQERGVSCDCEYAKVTVTQM